MRARGTAVAVATAVGLALPVIGSTTDTGFSSKAMASEVATAPSLIPAPAFLEATPGDTTVSVSWRQPPTDAAITGYTVQSIPASQTMNVGADSNSALFEGLANGVTFKFVVVAHTVEGDSAPAESSAVTPTGPGIVREASAYPHNQAATITILPPSDRTGVIGYEVVSNPGGLVRTIDIHSDGLLLTGLENGVEYTFTVTAFSSYGPSIFSRTTLPVVPATFPTRVPRPRVRVVGGRAVVRWTAPDGRGRPIYKYRVLHDRGRTKTVDGTDHKAVFRWLARGRHRFRVVAVNQMGSSHASRPGTVWIHRG